MGALYGLLICGWLGVVDTASLLPAAGAMQAGLAAAVAVTSTGGHGLYRSSSIQTTFLFAVVFIFYLYTVTL